MKKLFLKFLILLLLLLTQQSYVFAKKCVNPCGPSLCCKKDQTCKVDDPCMGDPACTSIPAFGCEPPLGSNKIVQKIKVTSSNFTSKGIIPDAHACDPPLGQNKSPQLSFDNFPDGTQSFALVLDDPDAPGGRFVHWVIFNIPVNDGGLNEGLPLDAELSNGTRQGRNDTKQIGYFGPCPPPKETHRYIFKVFALDTVLDLASGATSKQLLTAMKGHIIGRGKLVGLYKNNTNL